MWVCLQRVGECLSRFFCDGGDYEPFEMEPEGDEEGSQQGQPHFEIPEQQRAQSRTRARHRKTLRPKDASYSESILQDFKREEIPTELAKLYDMKGIIGIGTTSKVYLCKRRARPEAFACKVIDKRKLNIDLENKDLLLEQLRKEIEILQQLTHPNIVEFQDVIETADKIFVVMELVQGGELFEYLLERGPLPEDVAVHIMKQVMSAIAYMHERGIVHRDLKAENLLLTDPSSDYPTVKLIDFGFSTILHHCLTGSFLGTVGYLAPEIRQQRLYSEGVDIWACGVLLYLILSCRLPFNAEVESLPSNRQQVKKKFELSFPEQIWASRSDAVKSLLRKMLDTDPMRRYTARQVLRHSWITGSSSKRDGGAPAVVADGFSPALPRSLNKPIQPILEEPCLGNGHAEEGSSLLAKPLKSSPLRNGYGTADGNPPHPPPASDGGMRHCRSSMNLERMLMPVNVLSRTPPLPRKPRPPASRPPGGGGGGGGRRDLSKPVIVSYCPQTLHNSVAGDLSSTSNLSMKYSSQASDGKKRSGGRRG